MFLVEQLLWECGGTLAAPAIAGGVIHKALAFIAPKLVCAPCPLACEELSAQADTLRSMVLAS